MLPKLFFQVFLRDRYQRVANRDLLGTLFVLGFSQRVLVGFQVVQSIYDWLYSHYQTFLGFQSLPQSIRILWMQFSFLLFLYYYNDYEVQGHGDLPLVRSFDILRVIYFQLGAIVGCVLDGRDCDLLIFIQLQRYKIHLNFLNSILLIYQDKTFFLGNAHPKTQISLSNTDEYICFGHKVCPQNTNKVLCSIFKANDLNLRIFMIMVNEDYWLLQYSGISKVHQDHMESIKSSTFSIYFNQEVLSLPNSCKDIFKLFKIPWIRYLPVFNFRLIIALHMFDFFDSLCGCFSPQIKRNIIQYLSSAKLNQQVIEEEKTNQEAGPPQQSIYTQVKTKSYYFMKLQQDENNKQQKQQDNQLFDNSQQPNYYPLQANVSLDQIYKSKLACLQKILREEIGVEYSKIYDSQDETALKIYCKQEIYQNKRFNSYRFSFQIPQKEHHVSPKDYLSLKLQGESFNLHQPLLSSKEKVSASEGGLQIFHRRYKKILVINQHQLYTAQKAELIQQEGNQVVYNTVFSVKGEWIKLTDCSRGWVNLAGLKISTEKHEEQISTSLQQSQGGLVLEGYINTELEISVNANMLKQPIAKQIRVYVQKLICSLTKSDAI